VYYINNCRFIFAFMVCIYRNESSSRQRLGFAREPHVDLPFLKPYILTPSRLTPHKKLLRAT